MKLSDESGHDAVAELSGKLQKQRGELIFALLII